MSWTGSWCDCALERSPGALAMALIGIFGGTFDPVHFGHLRAARDVYKALQPDDFRFLPAGEPPHRHGTGASAAQRLHMLQLALADEHWCVIDQRELRRKGPSWMVTTLESFREEYPQADLCLVLGQDSANSLDSWHEWQKILRLAHLVIMSRPGEKPAYSSALAAELKPRRVCDPEQLRGQRSGGVLTLAVPPVEVSSTLVRQSVERFSTLCTLVPMPVARYIEAQDLYGPSAAL